MQHSIIIADDDPSLSLVLSQVMREQGYEVLTAGTVQEMMHHAEAGKGNVVITDVLMPGESGLDALPRLKQIRPDLPVIVISAQNTLMTAVKSSELGAFDYLPKPFDLNELIASIEKALSFNTVDNPQPVMPQQEEGLPMIGRSAAMQGLYKTLSRLIAVDLTVLLEGESGTGKEVIARSLHQLGPRRTGPFVAVNMAAIPRELVESELFGHEKGAFTGATTRKAGKFEQARGGTLFLDEIGDMPKEAQTKLLRVLQEGEYTSVGGNRAMATDVRVICATHRNLRSMIAEGSFREDLYYRLNVVPLRIPALRERGEDIAELCEYFVRKAVQTGLPSRRFSPEALQALRQYSWPGNVRELENLVYRLCALSIDPVVDAASVREELRSETAGVTGFANLEEWVERRLAHAMLQGDAESGNLYEILQTEWERPLLEQVLRHTQGNQIKAAQILGINRNTLRKKIAYLGILPARWVGRAREIA